MLQRNILELNENIEEEIEKLKTALREAESVFIGAGAGLSTSAGLSYSGERFDKYFSDFRDKYGITDMYSGGFYPFRTQEEFWAWWSRHIFINRYDTEAGKPYCDLLKLIKNKDYFVITTNVDHQFQKAGFDKKRLFYTQGDYGLFQCSKPCHNKTYENEQIILKMCREQKDMKIPAELIPKCPVCGEKMTLNLRVDDSFVEDEGWHNASQKCQEFINQHMDKNLLLLELGVGANTPVIIKYPFWQITLKNKNATYACINYGEAVAPKEIEDRSICINEDIGKVLERLF